MDEMIKLWCPLNKEADGSLRVILSDTSIDRDEEMMGKELIRSWSTNKALPMLVDHSRSMEKFIGAWKNFNYVEKGENAALMVEPFFFTANANPLSERMKNLVDEAMANGLNPGVSIGAIPHESIVKDIGGKKYKVYTKAELVEASIVIVPSNRNANFLTLSKSFDLDKKSDEINKSTEAKMEEIKQVEIKSVEKSVEILNLEEVNKQLQLKVEESEKKADELDKRVKELESKVILKGTVEGPMAKPQENREFTLKDLY
jgi:hypothetical protein